ncbi:unnamed protein product, partial [Rotaria sp. Silwood2]
MYTVYFFDYGNIVQNVPLDHIYSSSNDLDQIEAQAHRFLLGNIKKSTWDTTVRPLIVQEKLNNTIELCFLDKNNSVIHIKFDNENNIYILNENENNQQNKLTTNEENKLSTNEQTKTFKANISGVDKNYFYIHIFPDDILHIYELQEILQTRDKQHKTTDKWSINDLCIVLNDQNTYYRGQILSIDDNKYDVKCIDYGNILENLTYDHLYVLPNEEIFKQSSLAHQCRLCGFDDINQSKAIEEVIKNIQSTEDVKITIENDRNDQCLVVILARENNKIVNDQYQSGNNNNNQENDKHESDNDKKTIDSDENHPSTTQPRSNDT